MLKLKRYRQWVQALRRASLSASQWLGLLTIPFTERRVTKRVWRRRMAQCVRCPIYNHRTKTCMLCDCYMPIKACFADQQCAGEIEGNLSARGWRGAELDWKNSDRGIKAFLVDNLPSERLEYKLPQTVGRRPGVEPTEVNVGTIEKMVESDLTQMGGTSLEELWSRSGERLTAIERYREATEARGVDGAQIINDQQKENDE